MRNQKLYDYFANQHGLVLVDSELHEITLEVCKSIGIDSNEPAEWVEKMKQMEAGFTELPIEDAAIDRMVDRIFESEKLEKEKIAELHQQIEQLQAELKQLKGE